MGGREHRERGRVKVRVEKKCGRVIAAVTGLKGMRQGYSDGRDVA